MPTAIEWPMANSPDPPAPLVAAWLAMLHVDGTHMETHENVGLVPWIAEQHEGYVVRMCQCNHWYITARSANPGNCGAHG